MLRFGVMVDLAKLEQLASQFRVVVNPSDSPLAPYLALQPPAELVTSEGLRLVEITQVTEKVPGLATLYEVTYALKNVRFAPNAPVTILPDPAQEDVIGGVPIMLPLVVGSLINNNIPPNTLMSSETPAAEQVPGIPGILGSLKAKITPEIEKLVDKTMSYPVKVESSWSVRDPAGNVVTGFQYETPQGWVPLPTTDLGLPAAENVALRLRSIVFSQLTNNAPEVRQYNVQSRVRLSVTVGAQNLTTGWTTLPPVPITIPTIPVPAILALYEHRDFGGRVCVCVPTESLIGAADAGGLSVAEALTITTALLGSVAPNNPLVTAFVSQFPQFVTLVPQEKQVVFARRTRIANLSDFVIEPGFGPIGRLTGEDMASSLICIAPPGTIVNLFDDRDWGQSVTKLQLTIGSGVESACGIALRDLDRDYDGLRSPESTVFGGEVTSARPNNRGYSDRISSLEWLL
ncbi:MAG: hypothetical protein ACLGH0_07380 [Thermoanaerobaculia bacterium]